MSRQCSRRDVVRLILGRCRRGGQTSRLVGAATGTPILVCILVGFSALFGYCCLVHQFGSLCHFGLYFSHFQKWFQTETFSLRGIFRMRCILLF